MSDVSRIGFNIKSVRLARHMTRSRLARAVGVSEVMIWNYEINRFIPPISRLFLLAWHLDVPIGMFWQDALDTTVMARSFVHVPDGSGVFGK